MSATTHQIKKARRGKGRGQATKDKVLVSDRGYLWQSFVNLNTAVVEEVGPTLDWVKVNCPDLYEKLSVIEEKLVFDTEPRKILPVLEDIRDWMTGMVEIVAQREKVGISSAWKTSS